MKDYMHELARQNGAKIKVQRENGLPETVNFIHIAKNAGTSMKDLAKQYPHLKIIYHSHNAPISQLTNQMLVIRNPFDRFCSAVQYAIENYSHSPKVAALIEAGLTTPSHWAEAWGNPTHPAHHLVLEEVVNQSHSIDNKLISYKWTYEPQTSWFNGNFDSVKYLIPYDKLEEEINRIYKQKLPYKNAHFNQYSKQLSDNAKNFILKFYASDFELWNKVIHMT